MNYLDTIQINLAIDKLKNNEIVVLPTDTIYGFSSIVTEENRIKINQIKNSDLSKPLIILISNLNQLPNLNTKEFREIFLNHKGETIVLNLNNKTIALRLVDKKDLVQIIDAVGPIFSTSVNISGQDFLNKKEHFLNFLNEENIFYIGRLEGKPSRIYSTIESRYLR